MNETEQAKKYYTKVIVISENSEETKNLADAFNGMSNLYSQKNQVDSAIYFAKKAIVLVRGTKFLGTLLTSARLMTELYTKKGIKDSTLAYLKLTIATKDSLFGQEKVKQFQSVIFDEQLRQQQIEANKLQYKNQVQLAFLFTALAVFLLIAIILYRHDRQKQKANVLLEKTLFTLKTTQTQLIQKERLASLGELTAGIAHEIQNPLNFVNNFSEVSADLIDELDDELDKGDTNEAKLIAGDLRQNLQKIAHHGSRASSIVRGMLEHSRPSSGERQPTDLNALCGEYLRLAYQDQRVKNKEFNCELITDFDLALPRIEVVSQDIGRVLLNLYKNAFYAVSERQKTAITSYQPTVCVLTKRVDNQVLLTVSDNGTGIPDTVKAKIFQPFFTTKPTGEGTGLGLSLSYDIVTKGHGGTIEVASVEGEDTTFVVRLPS